MAKMGNCLINNFYIEKGLKSYITQLWKGFNDDDIIVTRFDNNMVQESEYFLYGTLSNTSSIKKVLEEMPKIANGHLDVINP